MSDTLPDFETMTDDEIDAWTPEAEDATDPSGETEDPAPATEQSESETAPPATTQEPDVPAREATQDDPEKVSRTVPVPEYQAMRQRAQQEAEARQKLERELSELRAQQETQNLQARYDQILDEQGYEAAEQFRLGIVQRQQEAGQQQARNQAALERIQMSREVLMKTPQYADYEAQEAKVIAKYGLEEAQRLAARQANPALWAYEEGKAIQTPEEREAAFEAEVSKRVAAEVKRQVDAALSKQQPPAHRAVKAGVEHAGSDQAPNLEDLDPEDMTDAQLAAFDRESRRKLHQR